MVVLSYSEVTFVDLPFKALMNQFVQKIKEEITDIITNNTQNKSHLDITYSIMSLDKDYFDKIKLMIEAEKLGYVEVEESSGGMNFEEYKLVRILPLLGWIIVPNFGLIIEEFRSEIIDLANNSIRFNALELKSWKKHERVYSMFALDFLREKGLISFSVQEYPVIPNLVKINMKHVFKNEVPLQFYEDVKEIQSGWTLEELERNVLLLKECLLDTLSSTLTQDSLEKLDIVEQTVELVPVVNIFNDLTKKIGVNPIAISKLLLSVNAMTEDSFKKEELIKKLNSIVTKNSV